MKYVVSASVFALSMVAACAAIDEPRDRASLEAPVVDAGQDASAVDAGPPCTQSHDWRIRGLPASFFAGQGNGVGVWGIGDAFLEPDGNDYVRIDAYVAGSHDELLNRVVTLGEGHNASLDTFTHWIVLQLGCNETGSVCAPGTYIAVSGQAVVTRMEPRNDQSDFEMQAANVVLRRGKQSSDGRMVFTDGADACVFMVRLVLAGLMNAPASTCAEKSYPECAIVANAQSRHP